MGFWGLQQVGPRTGHRTYQVRIASGTRGLSYGQLPTLKILGVGIKQRMQRWRNKWSQKRQFGTFPVAGAGRSPELVRGQHLPMVPWQAWPLGAYWTPGIGQRHPQWRLQPSLLHTELRAKALSGCTCNVSFVLNLQNNYHTQQRCENKVFASL